MATLFVQRAISGGSLGEGAAIATAMVPFLLAVILLSYSAGGDFGDGGTDESSERADAQTGGAEASDTQGMNYLVSLPPCVTVYVPLSAHSHRAAVALLDDRHHVASRTELVSREGNPFWVRNPTLAHVKNCCSTPPTGLALEHDAGIGRRDLHLALRERARRPSTPSSGCAFAGRATSASACWPTWCRVLSLRSTDRPAAWTTATRYPDLPDVPDPVLHVAADGVFQVDTARARGTALDQ